MWKIDVRWNDDKFDWFAFSAARPPGDASQHCPEEDIAAQLGAGAAAADAALDALKEAAEAAILARANLVGRFAPLVAAFCHQRRARLPRSLTGILSYQATCPTVGLGRLLWCACQPDVPGAPPTSGRMQWDK